MEGRQGKERRGEGRKEKRGEEWGGVGRGGEGRREMVYSNSF